MKIAILDDYQDAFRSLGLDRQLSGHDIGVFHDSVAGEQLVARLADFDIALLIQQRSRMPGSVIAKLPRLKLISQTGHNVSHIDVAACQERDIVVSAGGAGNAHATSELAWGLILAALRRIPQEAQRLADGLWMGPPMGIGLQGKTLGIYAYGRIGKLVAEVARAFEMQVICWGREGSTERAKEAGFIVAASREAFFAEADVITLHLPLNDHTRGLITLADLTLMKPSALLVNTSRAEIITPGALVAAMHLGRPGLAAVDVFEDEPVLGAHHPLIGLPNVLCTPHLGYAEAGRYRTLLGTGVAQIQAYLAGAPINVLPVRGSPGGENMPLL